MATSLGYGIRTFNKKIPFRAPPPDTYTPDLSKNVAYKRGPTWVVGRPGGYFKSNRIGQLMTEAQRENVTLTQYIEYEPEKEKKIYDTTLSKEEKTKLAQKGEQKRKISMAPYDEREQNYEDHTEASKAKIVPQMQYRFKSQGSKYYKYAFPDHVPGPGMYYDYKQYHKHFFKNAVGTRIGKRPQKGRFDIKMKFYPSPDHYKPRITLTNPKLLKKTFGYHFAESNLTTAPGPGSYNVRTSLKGEIKEAIRKVQKRRKKPKSTKPKKRKSKSKTKRSPKKIKVKSSKNLKLGSFKTMRESDDDFRKTAFTTFGASHKNGWYHQPSCAPGPGQYDHSHIKKLNFALSTRASTALKSTFGVDERTTSKKTRTQHQVGPGQYEELDKNIFKAWIKRHSAKMLGRQKGWKKFKHNGNPGPAKYDHNHKFLKSQIKYSQVRSMRSNIFDGKRGPGPHHDYEIIEATCLGQIPKKSRTCTIQNCTKHMGGKAQRSEQVANVNPGPGKYSLRFSQTKPKSRQSTMAGKQKARKYKNGQQVPSPVAYDPLVAFNNLKSKSQGKLVPTGVGFPKSQRTKTRRSYFKSQYHKVRKKIGGPAFGFGTEERFPEKDEDDIIPGPGNYNAPSFTCTAPAYLFKKTLDDDVMFYQK